MNLSFSICWLYELTKLCSSSSLSLSSSFCWFALDRHILYCKLCLIRLEIHVVYG